MNEENKVQISTNKDRRSDLDFFITSSFISEIIEVLLKTGIYSKNDLSAFLNRLESQTLVHHRKMKDKAGTDDKHLIEKLDKDADWIFKSFRRRFDLQKLER